MTGPFTSPTQSGVAERVIAGRLFRSKRHPRLPSRSSVLAVGGVAAGVMSLILTLSIMGGFERALKKRTLQIRPRIQYSSRDLSIEQAQKLKESLARFAEMASMSEASALLVTNHSTSPVTAQGVDETFWNRMKMMVQAGTLPTEPGQDTLVLGNELATDLGLDIGDSVELVNPFENDSVFLPLPTAQKYKIGAIIRTGLFEWDHQGLWARKEVMDHFFGFMPQTLQLIWWLPPDSDSAPVKEQIAQALGSELSPELTARQLPHLQTWEEQNSTILQSMKVEQRSMFILLHFVVAVASLNIIILLTMTVNEKKPYIGMLIALGMTPKRVMRIFSLHGTRIGFMGTSIGVVLGVAGAWILKTFPIVSLPNVYYDQSLPIQIQFSHVAMIAASSFAITLGAALLPARRASQLNPIEALRS